MDLVQIHIIRTETQEAVIDFRENCLAGQAAAIRPFAHLPMDLGGDDNLVPADHILQSSADDFLAGAIRIHIRCIEKINAEVQRFFDKWPALFLIQ
ncbi:hypothetical protein D3C73_1357430 [compost metagenome]